MATVAVARSTSKMILAGKLLPKSKGGRPKVDIEPEPKRFAGITASENNSELIR